MKFEPVRSDDLALYKQIKNKVYIQYIKNFRKERKNTRNEYIEILQDTKITVLTTCYSGDEKLRQLQGKATEATAAGSLLFIQDCQSVRTIFQPWKEYVPFDSLDDIDGIVHLLVHYLENEDEREKIAIRGQQRMRDYLGKNRPWVDI